MKKELQGIMNLSYEQAEMLWLGKHISDRLWRAYQEVWTWTTGRFSNLNNASDRQEKFWNRYGKDAFYRRINKTRAAFGMEPITPNQPIEAKYRTG